MNFKKNGGFTLVELIVVIAILGLLAGIAVPQYSQYVEKAQIAADNQNLNMLHNVFVVACVENDTDPDSVTLTEANLQWAADTKTFSGLQSTIQRKDGSEDPIVESFNIYMGDPIQFKSKDMTAEKLIEGIEEGVETGSTNTFSTIFDSFKDDAAFQAFVSSVKNSTFGAIGAEGLMDKVDTVTGLAAGLMGSNTDFCNALTNFDSLAAALGYASSESEDFWTKYGKMVEQIQASDPTLSDGDASNKLLANYAVLTTASTTANKDKDTLLANLQNGIGVDDIKAMMSKDADATTQQEGVANAALMYAMYTAYANQLDENDSNYETAQKATGSVNAFVDVMSDTDSDAYKGFQTYLQNTDGQAGKDLDGYLGAMNIINQSANSDPDAIEDLLVNGYEDPSLVEALEGLLGN